MSIQGGFYFHPIDEDPSLGTPLREKPLEGFASGYTYSGFALTAVGTRMADMRFGRAIVIGPRLVVPDTRPCRLCRSSGRVGRGRRQKHQRSQQARENSLKAVFHCKCLLRYAHRYTTAIGMFELFSPGKCSLRGTPCPEAKQGQGICPAARGERAPGNTRSFFARNCMVQGMVAYAKRDAVAWQHGNNIW